MRHPIASSALWISGPKYDYGKDDAGYYRDHRNKIVSGTFALGKVPDEAWLSLAVLGYARVYLNGRRAFTDELVGDWTNFTKLVTYRSWNVAELLQTGTNEVTIELGNGFWNPSPLRLFGKYNLRERLAEVGTPQVLASIAAEDGTVLMATDASWTWTEGQLLFNNVYLGERRDLRLEPGKPKPVICRKNTRNLESAQVEPCRRCGTVRVDLASAVSEIAAVNDASSKASEKPVLLVDLGEMVTGFARIEVRAHEGDVVHVSYAEHLDAEGNPVFASNLAGMVGQTIPHAGPDGAGIVVPGGPGAPAEAREQDEIICREGVNLFENEFSTHSFRYAVVEGVSREDLLTFEADYVHTDLERTGTLETGYAWYDELLDAAIRTKLNNIHGIWEDCAREHLGYGGDMVALAESNLASFDCEGLIRKTVRDFRNDQTERGGVPETAPYIGIQSLGTGQGEGPLLWQIAYPYLVLEAYRWYGALDLVETEWPYIRKLVDYLLSRDPAELSEHCLGDHGSIETCCKKEGDWKGGTPDREFTGWCTILWFCRLAEELCQILDEAGYADASVRGTKSDPAILKSAYLERDHELAEEIRARFGHDGGFGDLTQTSHAFAGMLGLMDIQAAGDALADLIHKEDGVLSAGIFGASFAWRILHESGHDDVVEEWLCRTGAPSYHEMLSSGSGALAEQFREGEDSYNHAMFSSYVQWLYEALAGIHVVRGGSKREGSVPAVTVSPYFSKKTDHVRAEMALAGGSVKVAWQRLDTGKVELCVEAPAAARLEVSLSRGWSYKRLNEQSARNSAKQVYTYLCTEAHDLI